MWSLRFLASMTSLFVAQPRSLRGVCPWRTTCAPSAQQVMDRWHVIKNWRETLERVMNRVYARLQPWQDQSRPTPFPKRKKPRTLHEQAVSDASRERRHTRYEEV